MTATNTTTVEIPVSEVKVILALAIEQQTGQRVVVEEFETRWSHDKMICKCTPRKQDLHLPTSEAQS